MLSKSVAPAAIAEPGLGMGLDGARVAHAVGLAEGVGEQDHGPFAALGGFREHPERRVEVSHVLGEALLAAEAQRKERPHELQVVIGEELAHRPALPEESRRAELGAGIAGPRHRLDQRRPVGEARPADGHLEDAVGDGCGCDTRGHRGAGSCIGWVIVARLALASFQRLLPPASWHNRSTHDEARRHRGRRRRAARAAARAVHGGAQRRGQAPGGRRPAGRGRRRQAPAAAAARAVGAESPGARAAGAARSLPARGRRAAQGAPRRRRHPSRDEARA